MFFYSHFKDSFSHSYSYEGPYVPISCQWCEERENGCHYDPDSKYPASTVFLCHPPSWNLSDQVAKEERREDPTWRCVRERERERVKGAKK